MNALQKFYRLDNAANLYPAIRSRKRPGVFRVSATLDQPVQPNILQQALDNTLARIPSFSVRLRSGLFWHYFVHSNDRIQIQEDVSNPCMEISASKNSGFLIRVRYHEKRIALEVFHSVSDGSGAITFLKTLIAQYLNLLGHSIPSENGVLLTSDSPESSESKDNFHQFAGDIPKKRSTNVRAYHIKGSPITPHKMKIISGSLPINAIKLKSKTYNKSITEFIVAVYLYILNNIQLSESPRNLYPINIQVPVNLRRFHPTSTLRNFSAFVTPSIDPNHGKYEFEEILDLVYHFLRYEATDKNLRAQVAANVRNEKHPIVRILPLFLKNLLINIVYKFFGPVSSTGTISNLGMIEIPEEMKKHITSFNFLLGATRDTNISCAILGYKDHLRINFSSVIEETHVQRDFFRFLITQGIPVLLDSNKE